MQLTSWSDPAPNKLVLAVANALAAKLGVTPALISSCWPSILISASCRITRENATRAIIGFRNRPSGSQVTRDQVLAHARALVDATDLPVSVDLESGFGATVNDVAETRLDRYRKTRSRIAGIYGNRGQP